MTMVNHGDDKDGKGEKRSFDILARLQLAYGDEETRARRGKEKQERNMFMIDTITSAATKAFSGKRKIDHRRDQLQYLSSSSSSSSSSFSSVESKRRRGVSDEPIRAEPLQEIHPVRERNLPFRRKGMDRREAVRREPGVTPEWVVELMREKNGVEPAAKLIIEKEITASDLKIDQARLLMPFNQMVDVDFMNEEELQIIKEDRKRSRKQGVDVILVDSDGSQWKLNLKRWEMKSSSNYCLCGGWNSIVLHHKQANRKLKEGHVIRIWSFHSQDGKLFFAFLRLPPAPAPGIAQPQAHDQVQAVALPEAQVPDQAMALALLPAKATASSSSMAPVVTRDSNELCEESLRRLYPYPKRRRTHRVCVPGPTRDSGDLGQSILEGLDLNRPLPEMCMGMALLEAVQETYRRTSLVSFIETSQVSVTETSLLPVIETSQVSSFTETSLVPVTETTTLDLELRL